ncbi:MAG: hydantoinase/oxoprolinase family protein [Paracoccaceae bacterium]|nr:MAG: hydantoinase/oxoprolinase family protein [Paracoccaceae bacterium]
MAVLLGVDTGGTFTDAAVLDEGATTVRGRAKALTTRGDLSLGVGRAVEAALAAAGVAPGEVGLVSLSTTLATNALVEGQGARVALVAIGFDAGDLERGGLAEAMRGDPVITVAGGHGHAGAQAAPLDLPALLARVAEVAPGVAGFAVAARFATRNPAHEIAARAAIRTATGRPVTCSHELSAQLNGPRRALTAVLNARLIGLIDGLIGATQGWLAARGITAPLMVVRGDGALISADVARERPIETILSGPAASIVGARWLTGATEALVSDIGGTTTDVAVLTGGLPRIDPEGARVGPFRTMVEAVAMRTTGLGGDSEVHAVTGGLEGGVRLGPRRLIPVSLLAVDHGAMVHAALDRALSSEAAGDHDGRFVVPMAGDPAGLTPREAALWARIAAPMPLADALRSRLEGAALDRLVARGLVMVAGATPSDAAHVDGRLAAWDATAADKALQLLARRRSGSGERLAADARAMAAMIVDRLTEQTATCLLEAAFAHDPAFAALPPETLAAHPLLRAGLAAHAGAVALTARLGMPVIGLGASAPSYYGAVGRVLGCPMILPDDAGVANAIGAVAGQVVQRVTGLITCPAEGRFVLHLPEGVRVLANRELALATLEDELSTVARARALRAGAADVALRVERDLREAEIEGRRVFVEARLTVVASGRPRVAHGDSA